VTRGPTGWRDDEQVLTADNSEVKAILAQLSRKFYNLLIFAD
jgi:hypothetical protein